MVVYKNNTHLTYHDIDDIGKRLYCGSTGSAFLGAAILVILRASLIARGGSKGGYDSLNFSNGTEMVRTVAAISDTGGRDFQGANYEIIMNT